MSTKGSCAAPTGPTAPTVAADASLHVADIGATNQCELYVEDDPPRLVATGRVFQGGSTIHGIPLQPDWTRIMVDDVIDVAAPVPLPTSEIQLVGHASGTFLAWPKYLVMPLSAQAKVL